MSFGSQKESSWRVFLHKIRSRFVRLSGGVKLNKERTHVPEFERRVISWDTNTAIQISDISGLDLGNSVTEKNLGLD